MAEVKKIPVEKRSDLKDHYPFDCVACGHSQNARPSIMMEGFGVNAGAGNCLACGVHLHLEITDDNEKMISIIWSEWAEQESKRLGLES